MKGVRCAAQIIPGVDWQCGRFVGAERAARGETLCSVHDPACRAATAAAHLARHAQRRRQPQDLRHRAREATIIAIKELDIWWDGPGSEGRVV